MERPSLASRPQPPPCPEHPSFPVHYCCFDQACGSQLFSCVLCVKNKHVTCRPKMIIQVKDLPFKMVVEARDADPAGSRLEDKYSKSIQELFKIIIERTAAVVTEGRDRIEAKSVQKLGATTARFSLDNWSKFRQDWRVEYKPETKKIVLTKTNRIGPEKLAEHCQNLDEYLRQVFGQFLDRLSVPKIYLLRELPLSLWTGDGNVSVTAADGAAERVILFELEAVIEGEDGGKAWSKRLVSRAVHEVTVIWLPEASPASFQVGLANERQLERFKAKEQFKITETLSFGSEGRGSALAELSQSGFKIPLTSPFKFYIDLENKNEAAFYDSTGALSLSRPGALSENFLFVSLKQPGVKVTIKELS